MTPPTAPLHNATATCRDAGTLMATLGITPEPGPYVYGGHRYDELTDAVQYTQRQQASRHPRTSCGFLETSKPSNTVTPVRCNPRALSLHGRDGN
jgi:hypothetical protein